MLKALMIVGALSGDYTVPMESMDACLKAKENVVKQDKDISVLCIPRADRHAEAHQKIEGMLNMFIGIVSRLREEQRDYCLERPFDEECSVPSVR